MDVWSLPGPSRFLATIEDALRDGINLVLARPASGPAGLVDALERRLHQSGWSVLPVLTASGTASPLEQLDGFMARDEPRQGRPSVSGLYRRLSPGGVVIVKGLDAVSWRLWKELLGEIEHFSRGIPVFDRPLLVLEVAGVAAEEATLSATALRSLLWRDVVGELDMLVYVESLFERRAGLERQVQIRTIAKLAGWDFALAEMLAGQTLDRLLTPVALIRDLRQTGNLDLQLAPAWEGGGIQVVDGVSMRHAVLLAMAGDQGSELIMRIWAAHAAEVLPLVEIARRRIVQQLRPLISRPIEMEGQTVRDLADLEIGQLCYLAHKRGLGANKRDELEGWRSVRNRLAHLQPLAPEDFTWLNNRRA